MNLKLYFVIILSILVIGCASPHYKELYKKKPGFYSYVIGEIQNDYIYKEYASEVYATPASCQKIVTSLVAFKTLGPEYKYKTELLIKKKGKLIQDAVIKFSGDPTLTSQQLINILQPLHNSKVTGSIVLDNSVFKVSPYSPNLMIDDIGRNYSPPVSSINIDKNLVSIKVTPNKINKFAKISADLDYDIRSNVTTNDQPSSIKLLWDGEVINATGNINIKDAPIELKLAPRNHDEYVVKKIKTILKILIVHRAYQINNGFKLAGQIESLPLKEIIKPAMKSSDNLVLDSIYLTVINYSSTQEITDWAEGSDIIKQLIKQHFGIDAKDSLFVDGSGLSRYNRVQPIILFALLKKGYAIPEFISALPKTGEEDLTLKNHCKLSNNIIAKTGGMSGVSCLCGYNLKQPHHKCQQRSKNDTDF
ncbi:MAG: D-alanyl-D-alanine carboxypeptidase/D-alanyl-D-alanine-endopeptidase [Rickettsia endosymbiont of Ecitomorpha arachnoides]|nr:D-alanyl-D-alanine carboxypeptidase/D-alanyl-D-alanine-endopeptidase [Rickettsia endosymbiont of Ecitomorpha arachnoides]